MDLLYNRWWQKALSKPSASGLLTNCSVEDTFVVQLAFPLKILSWIFFMKNVKDINDESLLLHELEIRKFVEEKQYVLY